MPRQGTCSRFYEIKDSVVQYRSGTTVVVLFD